MSFEASPEVAAALPTPNRVLDLRGETCPYPPVYTIEELSDMAVGEVLEVITDNPPSIHTIPWHAAKHGHVLLAPPVKRGANFHLFLRVGAPPR
ncbi:MAG TPA: sulfurtransferase TusA family protein [Chloroflexota bacterium]|jgi:TusA-related sulfurtransferase|nr:sulfurtransferase TusA family protein [Chloroflexota bacterium]